MKLVLNLLLLLVLHNKLNTQESNSFSLKSIYTRAAISFSNGNNKSLFPFEPTNMPGRDIKSNSQPTAGQFIMGSAGVGAMLHKNIGLESNFNFLYGLHNHLYTFNDNWTQVEAHRHDKQLLWNNSLIFTTLIQKFHPYIKVGLIVPIYYSTIYHELLTNGQNYNEYHYQINSERNIGLNGCVGLRYDINDRFSMFIEAEEANVRTFYTTANLNEAIISGRLLSSNSAPQNITFGENGFQRFPISLQRESYSLGIQYKIGK